jgi:hypothetical protein
MLAVAMVDYKKASVPKLPAVSPFLDLGPLTPLAPSGAPPPSPLVFASSSCMRSTTQAKAFYMKYGFEESPTDPLHLLLLMKDVRKTLDVPPA